MPLAFLALIGSFFSRTFGVLVLKYMAIKIILIALVVTVLPSVLNNVLYKIIEKGMDFATANTASFVGDVPLVLQTTGFFAYIVGQCRLPEVLSMTISALAVSFTLRVLRVK
jgi:hypothetical protein